MRRHRSRLSFAEVLCSVSVGGGSLSLLNSSRRVSLSAVAASNDKIDISNEGTNDMKRSSGVSSLRLILLVSGISRSRSLESLGQTYDEQYFVISDVDAAGMQKEEGRAPAMRSGARTVSVPKDFAGFREFLAVARPMKSWRAMLALRQWVDRKAAGGGALLPSLRSERESSSAIHCGYLSTPEDLE
ncbi:hypothetical protein C8F04DRAFT_1199171 [Mycena alexandri]|uniref:Uncharacterized protein n=1 Tax=Mycena alexandri TaxID=1745969 RepID=A0AAD6WMQ9_9AGAR|nr:hypothetical protein C8F04DRAFT_1199171 [Mycena alexandri]